MEKHPIPYECVVFVCTNQREPGGRPCCAAGGSASFREKLKEMVAERQLQGRVRVSRCGCLNRCINGPNIMVFPTNVWYSHVEEGDLGRIFDSMVAAREGADPSSGERP